MVGTHASEERPMCLTLSSSKGEHDPRFTRTDFYVTAQVLQGSHGYSSGSKHLLELSESSRSSLVNNARNMGLFFDRPARNLVDESLETKWKAWIIEEKLRRLAWAVYVRSKHFVRMMTRFANFFLVLRFIRELSP
jgi:hypothetical protein